MSGWTVELPKCPFKGCNWESSSTVQVKPCKKHRSIRHGLNHCRFELCGCRRHPNGHVKCTEALCSNQIFLDDICNWRRSGPGFGMLCENCVEFKFGV